MSRMVRPCDNCGGDGWPMSDDGYKWMDRPCPRCLDMPWLRCPGTTFADGSHKCLDTQRRRHCVDARYKPDPDPVMRWCFTHNDRPECKVWGQARPCVISWVERPTRLDEVG